MYFVTTCATFDWNVQQFSHGVIVFRDILFEKDRTVVLFFCEIIFQDILQWQMIFCKILLLYQLCAKWLFIISPRWWNIWRKCKIMQNHFIIPLRLHFFGTFVKILNSPICNASRNFHLNFFNRNDELFSYRNDKLYSGPFDFFQGEFIAVSAVKFLSISCQSRVLKCALFCIYIRTAAVVIRSMFKHDTYHAIFGL